MYIYGRDVTMRNIYYINSPHNFGQDIPKAVLLFVLLAKYYSAHQIKKNKICGGMWLV